MGGGYKNIFRFVNIQWPSGQGAGFPLQGSRVQNHWVAPRSTQPCTYFRGRSNEYQKRLGT